MSGGREKKTLALFAAILLFGFSCICAYVFFGHNWNFAVSSFDDTFGDMESYTVLLYEGTIEPSEDEEQGTFELQVGEAIPSTTKTTEGQSDKQPSVKDSDVKEELAPAVDGEGVDAADEPAARPSLSERIARRLNSIFNLNTDTAASEEETEEIKDDPVVTEEVDDSSIEKAAESYEGKNAITFTINTVDPAYYDDGAVLDRGGKRIAVLSVHGMRSCQSIQAQIDFLRTFNPQMTVVVVDEVSRVAGVEGIDVIIRANADLPAEWNPSSRGSYVTFAPAVGSVAATIISPSNIVVTRVL